MQATWIASADYRYGEGCVNIELSQQLRPHLLNLKERFTKYFLRYALALKSTYAVRLYELLKQYEKIGSRTISVEDIRSLCGV